VVVYWECSVSYHYMNWWWRDEGVENDLTSYRLKDQTLSLIFFITDDGAKSTKQYITQYMDALNNCLSPPTPIENEKYPNVKQHANLLNRLLAICRIIQSHTSRDDVMSPTWSKTSYYSKFAIISIPFSYFTRLVSCMQV